MQRTMLSGIVVQMDIQMRLALRFDRPILRVPFTHDAILKIKKYVYVKESHKHGQCVM